jgi:hypothetical protein
MLAFGAMNWTSEWFRAGRGMSPEQLADQAVQLFFHGCGHRALTSVQLVGGRQPLATSSLRAAW